MTTAVSCVTDAARRIAQAHNALQIALVRDGKLACDEDGEEIVWCSQDGCPRDEIVFPIRAAPVTSREVQDWLDEHWRRFHEKMTATYGPVGALILREPSRFYPGHVYRVERHNADGSVTVTTVDHPRTSPRFREMFREDERDGLMIAPRTHNIPLDYSDVILELPVPAKDIDLDDVSGVVEAGWSVVSHTAGLTITDLRGRTYSSLSYAAALARAELRAGA